jgi:hypothetical protein
MNVDIGAEAAQFPEKEYINEIAIAVWWFYSGGQPSVNNNPICIGNLRLYLRYRQTLSKNRKIGKKCHPGKSPGIWAENSSKILTLPAFQTGQN